MQLQRKFAHPRLLITLRLAHLKILSSYLQPYLMTQSRHLSVLVAIAVQPADKHKVEAALWPNGALSRELIAKDADIFAERVGLPEGR